MNSEIYGRPTGSNYGFIYTYDFTHLATYGDNDKIIKEIHYVKGKPDSITVSQAVPLDMKITVSNKIKDETFAEDLTRKVVSFAIFKKDYQNNVVHPDLDHLKSNCEKPTGILPVLTVFTGSPGIRHNCMKPSHICSFSWFYCFSTSNTKDVCGMVLSWEYFLHWFSLHAF